ncbi:MAG: serine hydrolase domain-containing protein [Deltaproteobacteria bacterium]
MPPCSAGSGRPLRGSLSELAPRWAEGSGLSGSIELRRGEQSLARVDRLAGAPRAEQPNAERVFWIGSLSKQFAAAATLRLAERGRLQLHAPPADYLPELAQSALSTGGVSCSIEHLLSHTCGLPAELGSDLLHTANHLSDPV